MGPAAGRRQRLYDVFCEYYEILESKRRWNPFEHVPWERLSADHADEDDALCVETFFGVEAYVPDYAAGFLGLSRSTPELAWFGASWGAEEAKHAFTFREYLKRKQLRSDEQIADFERKVFANTWRLPFDSERRMSCYTAIQESVTHMIYDVQLAKLRKRGDHPVLERIYTLIGRDEAAHRGFYKKLLQIQMEEDREGTLEDLAQVAFGFRMPGQGLIPDYERRLAVVGVGLDANYFLQHGIFPLLKAIGTDRRELVGAYGRLKTRAKQAARRAEPSGSAPA